MTIDGTLCHLLNGRRIGEESKESDGMKSRWTDGNIGEGNSEGSRGGNEVEKDRREEVVKEN